jgi:hypothetical protein
VVSPFVEGGIDIQTWRKSMMAIRHKYLSAAEQLLVGSSEVDLTLAWCAKEAAYKWQGRRGVEFDEHMIIVSQQGPPEDRLFKIDLPLLSLGHPIRVHSLRDQLFGMAIVVHDRLFYPISKTNAISM